MHEKCVICGSSSKILEINNLSMRKCQKCGVVWREKFDLPARNYEEKKIDLGFEKTESRISNSKNRIKILKKYADLDNLCDIGTGEGIFLNELEKQGYKNLWGIEPNKKIFQFNKEGNVKIEQGVLKDIKNINENFNTITMFHVLEHLPNPLESLKLIYDNLQKDGHIAIETPDFECSAFKRTKYKHALIYPEHFFYFNENNLRKIIEKAGFKIVASGKRNFNHGNLGIRNCLYRLGIVGERKSSSDESFSKIETSAKTSRFKRLIKCILNKIVIISSNLDYLWIIAKK
jgi:SAM-dependent methyltransferase